MSGGRNIVQLRPRAGDTQFVQSLQQQGYRQVSGPLTSAPSPQGALKNALQTLNQKPDEATAQQVISLIANAALEESNHGIIFSSGGLHKLVEALEADNMATRTLACATLTNLSRTGTYLRFANPFVACHIY